MNILIKDFIALYQGEDLPELRVQYKDFSAWQNNEKHKKSTKRQEDFWVKEFEGELPVLELPVNYPRPVVQSFEGNRILFEIDKESTVVLKTLTLQTGAPLYMLLLALYTVFLSKITGQEDIVIGSPIAGRRHADLEKIIGMFVNTLLMRNYPSGEKTFYLFLEEVKEKTLKAFENQDYQYEDLVEKVVVTRDTSRNPLFDTMFVLQNMEIAEINIPDVKLSPYPYENKTAKFDLNLTALQKDGKLIFNLEYSTKLFKKETILRLSDYFKNLIDIVIKNPEARIFDIGILGKDEKKRILEMSNGLMEPWDFSETIHEIFEKITIGNEDKTALVFKNERMTYRELNLRANLLAKMLQNKGVGRNNIVGLMMERSFELLIGILGIMKAGGAYLPIDPKLPQERIDYMLKDSNAQILINKSEIRNSKARAGGFRISCFVLRICFLQTLRISSIHPEQPGIPKVLLLSTIHWLTELNWMQKAYPIDERDTILQKTTYTFDVSVWEIFWWSMVGARLCLLSPGGEKDPESIAQAIEKNNITTMHFVPSMLSVFLDYLEQKRGQARMPLT